MMCELSSLVRSRRIILAALAVAILAAIPRASSQARQDARAPDRSAIPEKIVVLHGEIAGLELESEIEHAAIFNRSSRSDWSSRVRPR